MNDRFKFRVFHKPTSKMYEVYSFDKEFIQATESLVVTSIKTFKTADCILEQCTGIKDKNGNLIYEGDIVELTRQRRWIRKGKRLAIKWRTFSCCGFCLEDRGVLTEKCAKECIVIGNIHENKEFRK